MDIMIYYLIIIGILDVLNFNVSVFVVSFMWNWFLNVVYGGENFYLFCFYIVFLV